MNEISIFYVYLKNVLTFLTGWCQDNAGYRLQVCGLADGRWAKGQIRHAHTGLSVATKRPLPTTRKDVCHQLWLGLRQRRMVTQLAQGEQF